MVLVQHELSMVQVPAQHRHDEQDGRDDHGDLRAVLQLVFQDQKWTLLQHVAGQE